MFINKRARLVYASAKTVSAVAKGSVGFLKVGDDLSMEFETGPSRSFCASKICYAATHGRWLSLRTECGVYCFEEV